MCLVITANCATQQAGQVGGTGKWCHIYGAMVVKLVASNEGQEVPLATSSSPDLALQEIQCSTEPSFQGCRCFRVKPTVGARTAHFGESDEGRTMWGKKIFCSQLIISRSRNAIFSPIHITRKIAVIATEASRTTQALKYYEYKDLSRNISKSYHCQLLARSLTLFVNDRSRRSKTSTP